jgi:hypothetical protein
MKRRLSQCVWIGVCALTLGLTGCAISLGSGNAPQRGTTLGKELMDLKEARDRGVISDSEYEEQRRILLHRSDDDHDHGHHHD